MPKEGLTPDRYISGETIHRYLNDFARDQGLVDRVRLQTRVTKIERMSEGRLRWRLTIDDKTDGSLETSKLIVASGVTSEAYVPNIPRSNFTKPVIHSGQLGASVEALSSPKTGRVVVLGAAKSAYDTVFHLLKHGKKVDWIIREDGSGPLAIAPPRLLGLFHSVDAMGMRMMGCLSPSILQTEGFWYHFLQRSSLGRAITQLFWRNLTRLAEIHAGYSESENIGKLEPVPYKYG